MVLRALAAQNLTTVLLALSDTAHLGFVVVFMPLPIQKMGPQGLCFQVDHLSVHACVHAWQHTSSGEGIL